MFNDKELFAQVGSDFPSDERCGQQAEGAPDLSAAIPVTSEMTTICSTLNDSDVLAPSSIRVVAAAKANARNYHLSGPLKAVAHLGLRGNNALAPAMMLNRFAWVHDHDVTAS